MGKKTGTLLFIWLKWQRRMGVEPTRDRAERPPSRFEDGETHRGPYTSICARGMGVLCHSWPSLSSEVAYTLHVYLCERFHHQVGFAQAGQVAITRYRDTAH